MKWLPWMSTSLAVFAACAPARGALYEFTIKANVIASSTQYPKVGDIVTVSYVADSTDLEPIPGLGRYSASSASVTFPGGEYFPVEGASTSLTMVLGGTTGGDGVGYGTYVRDPTSPLPDPYPLVMTLDFPRGSFIDESLPLSLDLSGARFTLLEVLPNPVFNIRVFTARVLSYESVKVPEPFSAVAAPILWLLSRRARRDRLTD